MMSKRAPWLATLGAVGFGLLAFFSGIDRYSEHQPSAVRLVPQMFRADAARVSSVMQLAAGNAEGAAGLAREAIDSDPLDARGPGILAAALAMQGEPSAAYTAFAAADSLGMREPLAEAYFFDRALQSGDFAEAARRLDILLRAHPEMTSIDYFFSSLEADNRGRLELVRWLSHDPLWASTYLSAHGKSDNVLLARARFLAEAGGKVELGCTRIEPMMRELTKRNYRSDAQRLIAAQCPQRALSPLLADPGFEAIGEDKPFGWRRHRSGDVRVSAVGINDRAVEIDNRAAVTRLVLSQPVAVEAGEFRIFASVSGPGAERVVASLDCGQPARPAQAGSALGRGQLMKVKACPDPVLGIWVRPGSGVVRVDDIRLESVGR